MPYDYERSMICKATGLTGVQAEHICKKLREKNIDPQAIDWMGAISDSRDWGDRYQAVQRYLANYYSISFAAESAEASNFNMYNEQDLEFQASTKKGVKKLLNDYYNSKRSRRQREQIKEVLLSSGPIHDVLMTAMYDGADMPYARRFLNEAMKGEVVDVNPVVIPRVDVRRPIIEPEVIEPVKKKNELVEVRSGPKPVVITPVYRVKKENNAKKYNVDMEKLYQEILRKKRSNEIHGSNTSVVEHKPVVIPEKKGLWDIFTGGISKEGDRWRKLLSQKGPKRGSVDALRRDVERLRLQNMPLQLQLERQRLLMQREQMIQLNRINQMQQRKSSVQHALGLLGFMPPQPQMGINPLMRPGYYIETRPKLPPGFRYKRIKKKDLEMMKEHVNQQNPMIFMY